MSNKYCEDCGRNMWKAKTRILKDGSKSVQYHCPDCKSYETFNNVKEHLFVEDESAFVEVSKHIGPKILHLDIETAPIRGSVWGLWNNNLGLNQIGSDWYILTWVAKWHRSQEIFEDSLPMHPERFSNDLEDDLELLKSIWKLLDEADIIVAHNGVRFDIPRINARFIYHGILPPSPYKQVDTLKVAKYTFKFTSNKLDYLANYLGFGGKVKTGGMELWNRCVAGEISAFEEMAAYNQKDVILLEDVYTVMRPWIKNHPNFGIYVDDNFERCTVCGSTDLENCTETKGQYAHTNLGKFELIRCRECGKFIRGRASLLNKMKKKSLLTNAL